jgi:hypothetical protein
MTTPAAAAARPQLAVPPLRGTAWALLVAAAAGAAAFAGAAPFIILATVLLVACGVGVLHSPVVFLWIITAISGIGLGWTDTAALDIAGRNININGLRWALVIVTCVVVLVRLRGADVWHDRHDGRAEPRPGAGRDSGAGHDSPVQPVPRGLHIPRGLHVPRELRGWLAFALLAAVGVLWSPDRFEGVKQSLLFAAPLLTAMVVLRSVRHSDEIAALRTALYIAAALGAVVGVLPALAGDVLGGSFDPEGRLLHRAFGTFMLPVMALSLARLRYGDARHGLAALALFALALSTLSRTTVATMILLAFLTLGGTSWRLRSGLAALVLLLTVTAYTYEPVRERIFADQRRGFTAKVEISGAGQDAQLHVGGLQLSGRGLVWLQTWTNAVRAPVLGHGTGSSTSFLTARTSGFIVLPHNEYLRAFHDLGALGLAALLAAFGTVLLALRRLRHAAVSRPTRELALAALLCWAAFVVIALFDNPLGYFVFFTHNVFLLTALALRSAQLERPA